MLYVKRNFYLPLCRRSGGGKGAKNRAKEQRQKGRGGIADTHFILWKTKRIFCMNVTMEDYECIHVILGVEKQKVKPTEIKENQ